MVGSVGGNLLSASLARHCYIQYNAIPNSEGICSVRMSRVVVASNCRQTIGAIGSMQEQICLGYLVSWDGMVPCILVCAGVFNWLP